MPRQVRRVVHAAIVLVAAAAYALPAALGLLADVGHSAYHLTLKIEQHRQLAEALGLVHESGRHASGARHQHVGSIPGHIVHSHGGAAHSHDAATDALLFAAERADEGSDRPQVPTVTISGHVPAGVFTDWLIQGVVSKAHMELTSPTDAPTSPPTPPPPRA